MEKLEVLWFQSQLLEWATFNLRDFPWRRTSEPYKIFVAECLLQRTSAVAVVPVYLLLLEKYPTLESLVGSVADLTELLQPLGLSFRAERLCQSASMICKKYNGIIPDSERLLLELPGVGKYTARAICASAFGLPVAVLDTNVVRIIERFFGLKGDRVKSRCRILWAAADAMAPVNDVGRWNLTLLDFGAGVCIARKPKCEVCPLKERCNYFSLRVSI